MRIFSKLSITITNRAFIREITTITFGVFYNGYRKIDIHRLTDYFKNAWIRWLHSDGFYCNGTISLIRKRMDTKNYFFEATLAFLVVVDFVSLFFAFDTVGFFTSTSTFTLFASGFVSDCAAGITST